MLKDSQGRSQLQIRWVNAQAMLANSLTKVGEDYQMNRFVACNQRWKIVDGPEMFSGRRRQQKGLDGLDEPRSLCETTAKEKNGLRPDGHADLDAGTMGHEQTLVSQLRWPSVV